jgi:AraC-like DNA-binding protein
METSILASAGRVIRRYLDAHQVDADALFTRCGLQPSLINESRTRYPLKLLCKVLVEAAVVTRNDNIGLELARFYSPLDLNALGITFLSSGTLTEALQRLLRYESVLNSNLLFSITESDACIHLSSVAPAIPGDAIRFAEDARMSILVDMCRLGLDSSFNPAEIAFTYPEPQDTGHHVAMFRCPVKFSQPISSISLHRADARRPFTAANRDLAVSGDQILQGMINDLTSSDIISKVKKAIIDNLPSGTPDQDQIARQVLVSSRTLQRRLADEDTNLRTLILEVRRDLAKQYISDKSMPLAEISYMLGFSDTSSFSRAFKQWTGQPPVAFRQNLPA